MARARRLAAAGAVTAFVVAGVSLAAGYGTAAAASPATATTTTTTSSRIDPQVPGEKARCVLSVPVRCDEPDDSWSGRHGGDGSWSTAPAPGDTWSSAPDDTWSSAPGDTWSGVPAPGDTWSGVPGPGDTASGAPAPGDTWSSGPVPQDSWSSAPGLPATPWRPAGEREHRVPRGYPETGGGGLAGQGVVWPFAVGGAALLAGAGLTGYAVRRGGRQRVL
ncbi:hypothetical protein MF672_027310 [Actinomadura sp. ATCC 31491]|uniref:LPXTG cell wall anchor domain-containing protein n=1 Tax=Actinomadura luzonensis TaxID=2805427 RepID=A0ABT0FZT1_9ACTN|nr:hypothetical protein [Actinomadura luzonensis]MCK2217470.1 hypothetical protein [Actinomadura luzonensis]